MNTSPTFYERVTYRPEGGRARTIYLHRPTLVGGLLTGIEVNREGDDISGAKFDDRRHLISIELVVARVPMRMDNTYGELVEAMRPKTCDECGHYDSEHKDVANHRSCQSCSCTVVYVRQHEERYDPSMTGRGRKVYYCPRCQGYVARGHLGEVS